MGASMAQLPLRRFEQTKERARRQLHTTSPQPFRHHVEALKEESREARVDMVLRDIRLAPCVVWMWGRLCAMRDQKATTYRCCSPYQAG